MSRCVDEAGIGRARVGATVPRVCPNDTAPSRVSRCKPQTTCQAMGNETTIDTFGHAAGDHVLSELGKVIRGAGRKSDLACRYASPYGEQGLYRRLVSCLQP